VENGSYLWSWHSQQPIVEPSQTHLRSRHLELVLRLHILHGIDRQQTGARLHPLARTDDHLQLAQSHADQRDAALDLFAEELRLAHGALGEITGQFTADDLLGEIFGRFCIGK